MNRYAFSPKLELTDRRQPDALHNDAAMKTMLGAGRRGASIYNDPVIFHE